jgi:hypothetical protein
MTATLPASAPRRLPLWRLVTGLLVLGTLFALLLVAVLVYVDNFRLDRYMRALVAQPASAGLSDTALTDNVLVRAAQLGLPVRAADVEISREGGRPVMKIAKYSVQTKLLRLDLRLPEASSR